MTKKPKKGAYKKKSIPKAIREQVWYRYFGKSYQHKCYVTWCYNNIDVFNFHVGHNNPESRGGNLNITNLRPICSRCNHSMSNNYTISEWNKLGNNKQESLNDNKIKCCIIC